MRFLMLMIPKGYESAAPGTVPDAKAVAAMMKYNESLQKAGVADLAEGLHPPSMGARVSFAGGKPKVTDGPFAETKEVLGGFWMIDVKSKEEAVQWATRCPGSENEIIEVRQVQEMEDFPADVQAAAEGFQEMQGKAGKTNEVMRRSVIRIDGRMRPMATLDVVLGSRSASRRGNARDHVARPHRSRPRLGLSAAAHGGADRRARNGDAGRERARAVRRLRRHEVR